MTKRELAQRLLLAVIGHDVSLPAELVAPLCAALCNVADALHAEMDKRAEAWHDAQPASAERPGPWDPS